MRLKKIYLFIFMLFISFSGFTQRNFRILNSKERITIPFTLVNNMIVIKVEINGKELPFLFDSGIDKTVLFNLKLTDSITIKNAEKIKLRGLGEGEPIDAIKSRGNLLRMRNIINPSQMFYVILDNQFGLSAKLGIDINGIIGGDLLKSFIVKINYSSKKITFYNPKSYTYKKCKNCLTLPLEFFNRKPLIDVMVQNHLKERFKVRLLIDSGSGDAIWLFENTHPKIKIPEKYFDDYLGKGLSGNIYGKKSRIEKLLIGDFILEKVSVSYPDSTSIVSVHQNKERNGTLGADILKRFHVIFDYPNSKITLKKNRTNFKSPFYYNKSGIELVYGGEMLVKENKSNFNGYNIDTKEDNSITQIIFSYGLAYKPSYQISVIRDGSPARMAGLLVGDILLEINGKIAYNYKLQEIVNILSGKENKKIKILIDRNGRQFTYQFFLKDLL